MNVIKLKPKQLELIKQTTTQKAELSKLLQEVQQKELLILELLFEQHDVVGEVHNIKLQDDTITYEVTPEAVKEEKKSKAKK